MTLLDILLFLAGKNGALAIMALFLLLSFGAIIAVGLHDLIAWWWNRGIERRNARLNGERS